MAKQSATEFQGPIDLSGHKITSLDLATSPTDAASLANVTAAVSAGATPDADPTTKGKLQLTNDFGGTAAAPTVVATHLTSALPILQGGTGATTAAAARTALGLSTMATQSSGSVSIVGGVITGITDLAIADGGTGSSTAAGARTNLGLGTSAVLDLDTDGTLAANSDTRLATQKAVKTYTDTALANLVATAPAALDTLNELAAALGNDASFATTTATNLGLKLSKSANLSDLANAATARTNLGLSTMATQSSGSVSIVGGVITGITDLTVADGGTGASTAAGARTNLGLGTAAVVADSTLMHLAGAETITGAKTFNADTLLDKGSEVFNVKAYGAVGDGTTDDTTAIQNAINAAATAKGIVFWPQATYYAGTLTLKDGVSAFVGTGAGSILKLKNSAGTLLISENFATAAGSANSFSGTKNFRIENLKIIGNSANQTDSAAADYRGRNALIKLYSWNFLIRNVRINDAKELGLYTEHDNDWNGEGFNETEFGESTFENVFIKNYGKVGWVHRGPHDSHAKSVYISSYNASGLSAVYGFVGQTDGMAHYGSQGMIADNLHVWGDHSSNAMLLDGTNIIQGKVYAEGATGAAIKLQNTTKNHFEAFVGYAANGVELAGISDNVIDVTVESNITGSPFRLTGAAAGNICRHLMGSGSGAIFTLASYTGGNNTFISGHPYAATLFSGTTAASDRVDVVSDNYPDLGRLTRWELPILGTKYKISESGIDAAGLSMSNLATLTATHLVGDLTVPDTQHITMGDGTPYIYGSGKVIGINGANNSIHFDNFTEIFFNGVNPNLSLYSASNQTLNIVNGGGGTASLAISGALVPTVSSTSTLTNKTLTSPVINTPTGIVKGDVGLGNVDNTSDVNKPVSTAQATAIALKLSLTGGTLTGSLGLDGTAARDITMARATSGAGLGLTITSGGAQSGSTDTAGGDLTLQAGIGTGSGAGGKLVVNIAPPGSTGIVDQTAQASLLLTKSSTSVGQGITLSLNNTTTGAVPGLNLNGNAGQTIQMVRQTTANTAGNLLIVRSGGATSAATDKAAGDLYLSTGVSTGTGGANVRIQTMTRALSTGTGNNTATDRVIITSPKSVTNNSATTLATLTQTSGSVVSGMINYTVEVTDGTDFQYETGTITYGVTNKGGVTANNVALKSSNQQAVTAGTLAVTFTVTNAASPLIQVNANSSLTPSTGYPRVTYVLKNLTQQAVTIS